MNTDEELFLFLIGENRCPIGGKYLNRSINSSFSAEVDAGVVIDFDACGGGGADPVEVAESPEVCEADEQDAEEKEHVDDGDLADFEGAHAERLAELGRIALRDRPGIEQRDFHVENQVHQCDDVEAEIELDPA